MPPASSTLHGTLGIARRDLLDLGLRSTLLNYRPSRARGVEVIDERPEEVFRLLVREERSMTFLSSGTEAGGDELALLLAQPALDLEGIAPRHQDLRLQTLYSSTQLQSRLLATWHAARTSMEEQGVNTLYLALGMLVWCEEESPEKFYRAPLILVPVEIARSDARDRFSIRYSGEDLGENVSLAEKLKQEFGIRTFPELPDANDVEVGAYFRQVADSVQGQPHWSVDSQAIALGFFSFSKFLMYRDLDPETWPFPDAMLQHRVIQSLLDEHGFAPSASEYRDDCLLDDQLARRELPQVVDSDSSQTLATLDALDGHNMVIQGPPGTGKSQTIVNLIAGAIAAGKRVLFVSEKMAALDVVKRRLDHVGLGGACLELHSNRTNKKSIIEELRRTAVGDRCGVPASSADLALLGETRERLNAYCKAVNESIGSSGENPCSAFGKLLALQSELKDVDLPAVKLAVAAEWSPEEIARRTRLIEQLQDRVARSGVPSEHPFWGSRLTVILPTDREEIRSLTEAAVRTCIALENAAGELAKTLTVAAPVSPVAVEQLIASAGYIAKAPNLIDADLSDNWLNQEAHVRRGLAAGIRHRELHLQYDALLRPEAWSTNVTETRLAVAEFSGRWWRFVSGRWRSASRALAVLCSVAPPEGKAAQLALLDAIGEAAQCSRTVAASPWKSIETDWDLVSPKVDWVIGAWQGIRRGTLAAWCVDLARLGVNRASVIAALGDVTLARHAFDAAVKQWSARLECDVASDASFASLQSRWTLQISRIDELHALVAFNQIAGECGREGLQDVARLATTWLPAKSSLVHFYQRIRLAALLDRAFRERPALAGFDGLRHGHTVDQFRRLDLLQLTYNRALLAGRHAQSMPSGGAGGEVGILWREFEKRTRFLPVRSLMLKAGHAIQSIKPVFMMSPLSIANYLPPGALQFDLVVFDEASQVRPVDALGAIVRGQQVVVVGDSKQLPPTSFFDSFIEPDETESEEDEGTATSDIESLLGLLCSRGAHQRMLRWHYRSRHESLIAVSNHLFYEDRLVVFPSPERERNKLGLRYRRMENAAYERSRSRTNPVEARTVAASVMDHARAQLALPKEQWETLGVAAFSVAQMDAILNQLELLRRQDSSCEDFFTYPPHEPFFVKNLENVQGDERDVIFISIGYGRTAEGYLAMSFGPLNRTGGERRLNVLISRARKRCEVFTSLSADDIDVSKSSAAGVIALKTFLQYAATGQMDVARPSQREADSDFEDQVRRALTGLGYSVESQVGSAGFFLDLAVVDAASPGRYLLGIECDGARYHSARSARDRDRLRQAVLEGLGWRIHRIWSTDWFRHPEQELRKVVEAIELARTVTATPRPAPAPVDPPLGEGQKKAAPAQAMKAAAPYCCAEIHLALEDLSLHELDRAQLADALRQVVAVESPVHRNEAIRRVLNAAGVQRLGSRIQQAFDEALRLALHRHLFVQRGDFLWAVGMERAPLRDRSGLPSSFRKIELVPADELRRAIFLVVQQSYGMLPPDLPAAVGRLLGFSRVNDDLATAIERHRDELVTEGVLARQGLNLVAKPVTSSR